MDTITYESIAEDNGLDVNSFTEFCLNYHISAEDAEGEISDYTDSYYGYFGSHKEFGEFHAYESCFMDGIHERVWRYFDFAKYAHDLFQGGDFWETDGYYFRSLW